MDLPTDHHEYCTGGFHPDDIVISGVAGRFPDCDNVGELAEAMYQQRDLIIYSPERYEKGTVNMPMDSCGLIKCADKFDADYFCISHINAHAMDPSARVHIEVSYEAMADAGYNPCDLKGMKVGVYNATTCDDAQRIVITGKDALNINCIRTMNANRTSYSFDFIGPSFVIDSACSSSAVALWCGYKDLLDGTVDFAVCGGCQLNLSPDYHRGYVESGISTKTGMSRPFDARTDGMLRTEAVTAVFLQKAKFARRAYCTVATSKFYSAGFVSDGISVPSYDMEVRVMRECLEECNLKPEDIQYVECHGTGTFVGDPIEIHALDDSFDTKNRKEPLLVGTIKSNVGHTEASSGICGFVKSIIAFENDSIPPNFDFQIPNPTIPALIDGRIKVVTEATPVTKDYIPCSSFGFGGTVVETLLKRNPISLKDVVQVPTGIPRLVLNSGTTEDAVTFLFDYVKKHPDLTAEFYALQHKLPFTSPFLKPFRGYALYKDVSNPIIEVKNIPSNKRQVWFVLTGMGCQWPGMGLQLMELDVFAKSMMKSAATLKPFGIDLMEILRADKNYLKVDRCITPAFITISAIQIALVDLLRHLEIEPDGIIGHSTGELVCAYADGCCTAEQTILSALWRGKAVESANLQRGGMAAVGISWKEAQRLCPPGVHPACDNADDSVTISGLKEPLEKFVDQLKSENTFARVVDAYGYAFHCEYVYDSGPILKEALLKIIPDPKPRTKRWLSTSYPESEWDTPECKIADPNYFVHNMKANVSFNNGLKKVPADAILIEIGPHGLLQSILKRATGKESTNISLMKRNEEDNIQFMLDALGKLFNEGVDPKIEKLYPPVKFPVPRKTPMISDLVRWNHTQSFHVPRFEPRSGLFAAIIKTAKEDAYLLDHRIDGRSLFPATGYVFLAWEAMARKDQRNMFDMPIVIQNFKILRATILTPTSETKFKVNILESGGAFQIMEGKSIVASGEIFECKNMVFEEDTPTYESDDYSSVSGEEIYNELKMSGYEYGPAFQGLTETNMDGTAGLVLWRDKWIPFLDSLLLFFGLINDSSDFCLPTGVLSFKIDPVALRNAVTQTDATVTTGVSQNIPVKYNPKTYICRSVGVEISNLSVDSAPHRGKDDNPTLDQYTFLPYVSTYKPTLESCMQLTQYMCACNEVMNNVGDALSQDSRPYLFHVEDDDDFCAEEFMENLSEEHGLVSIMRNISENPGSMASKRKEWFESYLQSIGRDLLNNVMINEDSLRVMFEIIWENTCKKLSVLEIHRNFPVTLLPASQVLYRYLHIKFKKSLLIAPKDAEVEADVLEDNGIQLLPEDTLKALVAEKGQDIAISSFISGTESELQDLLRTLSSTVKANGFVLFFVKERANSAEKFLATICGEELKIQSQATLEKILVAQNLTVVSKISDPLGGSLYLLRLLPPVSQNEPCKVIEIPSTSYGWLEEVKRELEKKSSGLIWLVAQDSSTNGVVGMVNCLKQEPGGERVRCVFISQSEKDSKVPPFNLEHPFYKLLKTKNRIMNVWRDGTWGSFRNILMKERKQPRNVEHSYIHCRKYGDLSTFEWIESQVKFAEPKDQKLIHIYYSALNFRDVMLATGKLSVGTAKDVAQGDESVLGLEFCGRDSSGRRLCGFVRSRGMATSTLVDTRQLIEVPDHWSLEEAATVPIVYATCYYALIMRAGLKQGESILIHSGTGGIGMAAINIALSLNCEIYTTVGNDEKRKFLKKKFPKIKDENIGCSRNVTFKQMIMLRTNGQGVDVVLNSLADDKFQASLRCVRKSGRFVEIGKYDLVQDRPLGLKMFLQNVSFHGVFLDMLFDNDPSTVRDMHEMMRLVKEGIKSGVVKPLDRTVFGRNEVEDAFRYMAKGIHVGKVLLKIRDEEPEKSVTPKTLMLSAIPNTYFYSNKVYIVIGGLGGFGIEVTKWIIQRGGRNVILTSRYGERTPYHYLCLKRWKRQGINVHVSTMNAGIRSEAEKLLQEAIRVGPVGGIINSAVVLKDAFMDAQTPEDYREVCSPKAIATKNLDDLSRKLCPSLDYFICFSSISGNRGNAGQTNYGYANSVMERLCEDRRKAGLHGLAIQWGIIGEVGVVHRHMGDDAMIAGVMAQCVKSCLESLDTFCQQTAPVCSSYVTAASVKKTVQGDTMAQILKILGVNDISEVNTTRNFSEMGIDSMVGVEIKQLIESHCDISVSMQEIQDMRIDDVRGLFAKVESDKSPNAAPTMFTTARITLPATFAYEKPLVVLNRDAPGLPLFIVNICDKEVKDFQMLAKTLNRPVYALVWAKGTAVTDVETLAASYLNIIRSTVNGPYYLIGHSLGGSVAFEMALQSEGTDSNLKTLILVSGSEDLSRSLSQDESDNKDPEVTALCKFVGQFGNVPRLEDELLKVANLEQRIRSTLTFLISSSNQTVSKNELNDAISAYLKKHSLVRSYIPTKKLSKDIHLIEDPTIVLANDVTGLKELFSQVCSGKVTVQRVFSYGELSSSEGAEQLATVLQTII